MSDFRGADNVLASVVDVENVDKVNKTSSDCGKPIGVIFLEGHTLELSDDDAEFHTFIIKFPSSDDGSDVRQYVLGAVTADEAELWIKALMAASSDYLLCTCRELDEQISKLTMTNTQSEHIRLPSAGKKPTVEDVPRHNPFNESGTVSLVGDLDPSETLSPQLDSVAHSDEAFFRRRSLKVSNSCGASPLLSVQLMTQALPSFSELYARYSSEICRVAAAYRQRQDPNSHDAS